MKQCGLAMQFYMNDNNGILPLHSYAGVAGSAKRWIQYLTDQVEYVQNRNIAVCPAFYPEKYSILNSTSYIYGAHTNSFPGSFIPAGFTHGPFVKTSAVPAPSTLWILGDSVYMDSTLNKFIQIYIVENATVSTAQGGLHFRHLNNANMLFLDGHVKNVKRAEAKLDFSITKAYLQNCSLINL